MLYSVAGPVCTQLVISVWNRDRPATSFYHEAAEIVMVVSVIVSLLL